MKLRGRMVLTIVVTLGVVRVLLHILGSLASFPDLVEKVQAGVEYRMTVAGGREACEHHPSTWPAVPSTQTTQPEPFVRLYAYDDELRSANPDAPEMPPELRREFESSDYVMPPHEAFSPGRMLLKMPWDGPCAYILAQETETTEELLPDHPGSPLLFVTSLGVAVFLAAHRVVRRVRKLSEQVSSSADTGFEHDIDVDGKDEIADVAHRFNDAIGRVRTSLDTAARREQALREYIANTTHDVMIPLTVLQGHLMQVQRRTKQNQPLPADVVRGALYEAHYMGALIHNLAAAARLESQEGALTKHPVDLNALVERVVLRHAPIAQERGLSIEHACPPDPLHTLGDVTLLEQAVSNIVHNAIRHHDQEHGHVALVLAHSGDGFSLRIRDDGPGVAPQMLPRLTERSFQTDDARGRSEGLGLGLAICATVCDQHGFDLVFSLVEPRGLQATIRGPRSA